MVFKKLKYANQAERKPDYLAKNSCPILSALWAHAQRNVAVVLLSDQRSMAQYLLAVNAVLLK